MKAFPIEKCREVQFLEPFLVTFLEPILEKKMRFFFFHF